MEGLPVTIRLLDPPLHEFLPKLEETDDPVIRERIVALHEFNPMLGTRGCRLGILYPEIFEMQVRAIVRASKAVEERTGKKPLAEIMHPLVGFAEELKRMRELTEKVGIEENAGELRDRHHDRAAAGLRARGRDRRVRRLLLLRHQRPDADDDGHLARRRRGQVPRPSTSRTASSRRTRSPRSTSPASAT